MALVRSKTSAIGTMLVTGVLAFYTPEKAAAVDPARYTSNQVSLEADQEILRLRFHGGSTRRLRTYSLMGDGRLSIFDQKDVSAPLELVSSGRLLDDALSSVVGAVMQARLYALDSEKLKALRNREKTPGPYTSGAGSLTVEIHISLFPGTAADGVDDLRSVFVLSAGDLNEQSYPSVEELAALRQIVASVRRGEAPIAEANTGAQP